MDIGWLRNGAEMGQFVIHIKIEINFCTFFINIFKTLIMITKTKLLQ